MYTGDDVEIEEEQFLEDAVEVHDYLVTLLGLNPSKQVIVLGRSMGSGPAILLANQRSCAALVLFAPFKSLRELVSEHSMAGVGVLAPNMFNNSTLIAGIHCSTFIIHGTKDDVVPLHHSEKLFEMSGALPISKRLHVVNGMTHKEFEMVSHFLIPSTQFLAYQNVVCAKAYGRPIDVYIIKQHGTPPDSIKNIRHFNC